jgi:hypothetical protein
MVGRPENESSQVSGSWTHYPSDFFEQTLDSGTSSLGPSDIVPRTLGVTAFSAFGVPFVLLAKIV